MTELTQKRQRKFWGIERTKREENSFFVSSEPRIYGGH
jgi:hypothetical protein